MLNGEQPNPSVSIRIGRALVVALAFTPLIALMLVIAKLAFMDPGPAERRSGLEAAVFFFIVYGLMLYIGLWRMTRLTIRRFTLEGGMLEFETPRHGPITRPVTALRSVTEELQGRHGQSLRGWWLWFDGVGSIYLPLDLPNAELLVCQLGPLVGYPRAN